MSSLSPLLEKLISNRHLEPGQEAGGRGQEGRGSRKIHNEASNFIGLFNEKPQQRTRGRVGFKHSFYVLIKLLVLGPIPSQAHRPPRPPLIN